MYFLFISDADMYMLTVPACTVYCTCCQVRTASTVLQHLHKS